MKDMHYSYCQKCHWLYSESVPREINCIRNSYFLKGSIKYCKSKCSVPSHFNRTAVFLKDERKQKIAIYTSWRGLLEMTSNKKYLHIYQTYPQKKSQSSLYVGFKMWLVICVVQFMILNRINTAYINISERYLNHDRLRIVFPIKYHIQDLKIMSTVVQVN